MLNWLKDVKAAQRRFQGDFQELVRSLADDKPHDGETIARVLQDNGKTVEDLEAAVKLLQERRELRKQIDAAAVVERERPGLKKKIAEADRILTQAERVHKDTVDPLYWRLEEIKTAESAASDARRRLQDTCTYPALLGELKDVSTDQAAFHEQRRRFQEQRDDIHRAAQRNLQEAAHASNSSDGDQLRERGEAMLEKVKAYDKEIERLDKKIAELNQREQSIRERMLQA